MTQKYVFPLKLNVYNERGKLSFSWNIDVVATDRHKACREFERIMGDRCEGLINDVDRVIIPYKE